MKAEQMFKELGYERVKSAFPDWIEFGRVENHPLLSHFRFDTTYHQFNCALEMMNWSEIKAVIMQMKELGWIDEILGGIGMTYTNNFVGKKRMVEALSKVYKNNEDSDIANIELKKYCKGKHTEEFIILTWLNGAISTANNNMNSLSATARNVARMLDGGVYENIDYYKDIMSNEEWEEILG